MVHRLEYSFKMHQARVFCFHGYLSISLLVTFFWGTKVNQVYEDETGKSALRFLHFLFDFSS